MGPTRLVLVHELLLHHVLPLLPLELLVGCKLTELAGHGSLLIEDAISREMLCASEWIGLVEVLLRLLLTSHALSLLLCMEEGLLVEVSLLKWSYMGMGR